MSRPKLTKNGAQIKLPEPRQLDDIIKEYAEVKVKVADSQYLVYIYNKEVEYLNQRMQNLNNEAEARKQLDAKAAEEKREA
jgi:tRNA(Phe) wybutosine-synthesizing methylase Tyw3